MEQYGFMPDEFFNIRFLKEGFYKEIFNGQTYEMIGEDDVGNLVGIAADKKVFLLDTKDKNAIYISKDIKAFMKEIEAYYQYGKIPFPDNPSEEELAEREQNFRKLIVDIDPDAFCNEETVWSTTAEEMGYGII